MGPGGLATPNRAGVCGRPPTTRPLLTVREDGGVYSPSLRSRAVRLPPTPCRVCFRPCVFNKFSHFWQKKKMINSARHLPIFRCPGLPVFPDHPDDGIRSAFRLPRHNRQHGSSLPAFFILPPKTASGVQACIMQAGNSATHLANGPCWPARTSLRRARQPARGVPASFGAAARADNST